MKKGILFLMMGFFWYSLSWAQSSNKETEPIFDIHKTDSTMAVNQFGMNISPLLIQVLPFNRSSGRTGPYGFSYSRINAKNKFFRLGIGVFINDNDLDNSHLNLRIGGGKIRQISEKLHFTTGWDFIAFGGSFNVPNSSLDDDDGGVGFGPFMGIQYYLTSHLSFSTESFLYIGTSSNAGFTLRVIPPIAVFVQIDFVAPPKKKRFRRDKRNRKTRNKLKKKEINPSKPFIEKK